MHRIARSLLLAVVYAPFAYAPFAHAEAPAPANLLASLDMSCRTDHAACGPENVNGPSATAAGDAALARLEQRLRDTDAVGWLDKLAIDTEVDALYENARRHHASGDTASAAPLRRRFDALFERVLAMLRDGDPELCRDIREARTLIWAAFMDPDSVAARRAPAARELVAN